MKQTDFEIDTKGLVCPEPLMLVRNKVRDIKVGESIHILATDPSTRRDFTNYCRFMGHHLDESIENDGVFEYVITKGV